MRRELSGTSVQLLPPFLKTDVVGLLRGAGAGRNVTLRADMDALPILEQPQLPYRSQRPGLMHACGHDGHTAMLVGAARVLDVLRDEWAGSVRLVFQPGEEIAALGRDLVARGALKDPEPAVVLALHAFSGLPSGAIASKPGLHSAGVGFFTITLRGRGGHGSQPEDTIDPIPIAARVVDALQTVVSRMNSPLDPVVVSVCRIQGGTTSNVIPDTVEMAGTVRFCSPAAGERLPRQIEQVVKGICAASGASYTWHYDAPYVPLLNDPAVVAVCRQVVQEEISPECWVDVEKPTMSGEDFAYYLCDYPGALLRLGMGENRPGLHNSAFDFSDDALEHGILFLVLVTLRFLD